MLLVVLRRPVSTFPAACMYCLTGRSSEEFGIHSCFNVNRQLSAGAFEAVTDSNRCNADGRDQRQPCSVLQPFSEASLKDRYQPK